MSAAKPLEGRWIALEDRAIFRISGPDRVRFLNGQVTNDVSGPLDREAVAACLCSIKGKVEALVWISATENFLFLDGELGQRDFILGRLERYLIADDCEIQDETENLLLIHHFFPDTEGVTSRRLMTPGHDIFIVREAPVPFEEKEKIKSEEFEELSILSGIPRAGLEITGEEFPAELGLDSRAVNFHKGCYLGQEIISRIQSVGRVKRLLRTIRVEEPVSRGTAVENVFGERGHTTRDSVSTTKFSSLSLALFKVSATPAENPKNEPVPSCLTSRHQPK